MGRDMKKRKVASFPLSTETDGEDHLLLSRVMMTPSGKLIVCDGDNILVFKNRFTL